jgi:glycogen debranching enzyme
MIPNRFPAAAAPEYNAVDATLWMVVAVHRLIEASGEHASRQRRSRRWPPS